MKHYEHKSYSLGYTVSKERWDEFVNFTYVHTSRWQQLRWSYAPSWFLKLFPVKIKKVRRPVGYRPFTNG